MGFVWLCLTKLKFEAADYSVPFHSIRRQHMSLADNSSRSDIICQEIIHPICLLFTVQFSYYSSNFTSLPATFSNLATLTALQHQSEPAQLHISPVLWERRCLSHRQLHQITGDFHGRFQKANCVVTALSPALFLHPHPGDKEAVLLMNTSSEVWVP